MPQQYPYYIVQWREGRLPCPSRYRQVGAIRRMFDRGKIGGSRLVSREFTDPEQARRAVLEVRRDGHNPEVLIVDRPGAQRRRITL